MSKYPPEYGNAYERAVEAIERGVYYGRLNFCYNLKGTLLKIPPQLFDCIDLEHLELSSVGTSKLVIKELPPEIGQLKNLKSIKIHAIKLEVLPEEIGALKKLETLEVVQNNLSSLPDSIAELKQLKFVSFFGNQLKEVPPVLFQLKQLEKLNLGYNPIHQLPANIQQLEKLQDLNLSRCALKEIPVSVSKIRRLETLNLGHNKLQIIPDSLEKFGSLKNLDLAFNQLNKMVYSVAQFPNLAKLNLSYNQLKRLPKAIFKSKKLNVTFTSNPIHFSDYVDYLYVGKFSKAHYFTIFLKQNENYYYKNPYLNCATKNQVNLHYHIKSSFKDYDNSMLERLLQLYYSDDSSNKAIAKMQFKQQGLDI